MDSCLIWVELHSESKLIKSNQIQKQTEATNKSWSADKRGILVRNSVKVTAQTSWYDAGECIANDFESYGKL